MIKMQRVAAIVAAFEDELVTKLTPRDRVLVFFAGHGETRSLGGEDRGYLVPFDGTDAYGSLIPISQLHDFSDAMSAARHQLFILDSCFGGLAATRGIKTIDPRTPNFLAEVTNRRARQLLTAGGANQRVRDGGPGGHSLFTGQLLQALRDGAADTNGDGFIMFSELSGYIQTAAASYNQTPGVDFLAGHAQGDFWFVNPTYAPRAAKSADPIDAADLAVPEVDVYDLLRSAKQAFANNEYVESRRSFSRAAELGNVEAMNFLGKLLWEGWGGPRDRDGAVAWFIKAAERGSTQAMHNLETIYAEWRINPAEAARWRRVREESERLMGGLIIEDPTGGRATQREPPLPSDASAVRRPLPPTNLQVQ